MYRGLAIAAASVAIAGNLLCIYYQTYEVTLALRLMAGIGAGVYAGYDEASEAARPPLVVTEPDVERSGRYDEVYARYLRLSALLTEAG